MLNRMRNQGLTANARALRKNMTKEERHLWYDCLQDFPLSVHRQKVIGPYIVDFYCAAARLVIELDGSQHYEQKGHARDEARDAFLRGQELTVKRYSNRDVNERFQSVCEEIYAMAGEMMEERRHGG